MLRENEHDNFGIVDRSDDLVSVEGSGNDVAGGDPTRDPMPLQDLDHGVSDGRIMRSVTNEDFNRWGRRRIPGHPGSLSILAFPLECATTAGGGNPQSCAFVASA